MFCVYIRLAKSLSKLQHFAIALTTFVVPVSFEAIQGWSVTGLCLSCVIWGQLALYFVLYKVAMLVIASATRRDKAGVLERFDQMYSELTERDNQLSAEHQRQMTDMQDRVRDLQDWARAMRQALSDEVDVELPPLHHSARGSGVRAEWSTSRADGTVDHPVGWRGRLLRWGKRQYRTFQRWGRKILVDWEEVRGQSKAD